MGRFGFGFGDGGARRSGGGSPPVTPTPDTVFAAYPDAGGWWYDPNDLNSMFQDTSVTIPASVNSTVAVVMDKSGRGNHLIQATAGARPYLRVDGNGKRYLEFDGATKFMQTGTAASFSGTPYLTHCLGLESGSDTSVGGAFASSGGGLNTYLNCPYSNNVANWGIFNSGSAGGFVSAARAASPAKGVLSAIFDYSLPKQQLLVNQILAGVNTTGATSALTNNTLRIGRQDYNQNWFTGKIYGSIGIGAAITDAERGILENYINASLMAY